jgi:HSP20 family protein
MDIMKWRPTQDLFNIPSRFRSLLDDYTFPSRVFDEKESLWGWNPVVDVYENDHCLVVKAELPGMEKDQIAVDVQGRILTIKGERTSDKEVDEEHYYHRERIQGRFERAFTLPAEPDPEAIKAEYKDGILKIEVPKPAEQRSKKISVE